MEQNAVRSRVGELVAASGVKPKTLSMLCDLSPAHIGMILRGDVTDPDNKTLRAIAEATGASMAWLAFGEGSAPDAEAVRARVEALKVARKADPNEVADEAVVVDRGADFNQAPVGR